MSRFDDAMVVSWTIAILVLIPFLILVIPAGVTASSGDYSLWNGMIDNGLHIIGFVVPLFCGLLLIVGGLLD